MIEPQKIIKFVENGLHGGSIKWIAGQKNGWLNFKELGGNGKEDL